MVRLVVGAGIVDQLSHARLSASISDDATRHYFAWCALNVLGLPPHVIAGQLGHRDGGKLIVETYGHQDAGIARRRIRDAYAERGNVRHLPVGAEPRDSRPARSRTK